MARQRAPVAGLLALLAMVTAVTVLSDLRSVDHDWRSCSATVVRRGPDLISSGMPVMDRLPECRHLDTWERGNAWNSVETQP